MANVPTENGDDLPTKIIMNAILTEKEFQRFIIDRLEENGYKTRPSSCYNRMSAIDEELLFDFLNSTQPNKMKTIKKIYKDDANKVIVSAIRTEERKVRGSRLDALKHGVDISNIHLNLLYTKPATTFNPTLSALYEKNIFSIAEEVYASDDERVDLVIFLNGFAVATFELKSNVSGQSYKDAIYQYCVDRSPKTPLFTFKSGALVHFAMDLEQVYMTTELRGHSTIFLPFNTGCGTGIDAGAGNPIFEDKYSVYYMWENILQKDTLIEIISKFMFIEKTQKTDAVTGKNVIEERVIFPRYHQLDLINKLLDDVLVNGSSQNYLLQHAPGSGKTNEIAWLAYFLAMLHKHNKPIFDTIIVCTDRLAVDRQLQAAIKSLEHQSGFIKVLDENCTSADLAAALASGVKIIVTTIQKFPYITDCVANVDNKTFAIIIDEAHSSTSGKNMTAMLTALGDASHEDEIDGQDFVVNEMMKNGKRPNVATFAFTATPKATTLQMFGRQNVHGQKEAFHIYSMKQAIEEGFILDPLKNYTTYQTYYTINKEIEEDPMLQTGRAKREIARIVSLDDINVAQRIEIVVEHYLANIANELGGTAKAMIVTDSRESAVKYKQAFDECVAKKGYNFKSLVAFSGTVSTGGKEYTEVGINHISESRLPAEFDKDEYQFLIVADKYQTGFDQKKLCAMYIFKSLHGISTVQTLSRLNRICPPYDKKTFVLDFVNNYEDIARDFSKYYTATLLSNSITPHAIYDLEAEIDGYYILDPLDIERFNEILSQKEISSNNKKALEFLLQKTKRHIELNNAQEVQNQIISTISGFIRAYEFLLCASSFKDVELHKKYNFLSYLRSYFKTRHFGPGFDLDGKVKAINFMQKKTATHNKSKIHSSPIVALPVADQIVLSSQKEERLSHIVAEINSKTGKTYNNDVAVKAVLQIKDILMKSDKLRASARNNTEKDFELAYSASIDEALLDGLNQNQDFFTLLLNDDEIKKEVLGIFTTEIYESLKG